MLRSSNDLLLTRIKATATMVPAAAAAADNPSGCRYIRILHFL